MAIFNPVNAQTLQSGSFGFRQPIQNRVERALTPLGTTSTGSIDQSPSVQTYSPPSSGGGGGSTGGDAGGRDWDGLIPMAQIESIFNPITQFLGQAESQIRGQQSGIESDIRSLGQENLSAAQAQEAQTTRALDTQAQQGEQRGEDAISSARRLYNELVRGGQQRFGGSSSAGEAYDALSGREFQRNSGQIQQGLENFRQNIGNARIALRERTEQAVNAINNQTTRSLNEARRSFQDRLLEISRLRAESESAKAERRMQALQDLRNQAFQIRLADAQERAGVQSLATQLESQIAQYEQYGSQTEAGAQQGYNTLAQSATTNPQTSLQYGGPTASNTVAYTGQINRDEEELNPTGSLRNLDEFFA